MINLNKKYNEYFTSTKSFWLLEVQGLEESIFTGLKSAKLNSGIIKLDSSFGESKSVISFIVELDALRDAFSLLFLDVGSFEDPLSAIFLEPEAPGDLFSLLVFDAKFFSDSISFVKFKDLGYFKN